MFKWLRNIVLLAIVMAGALKLVAWYAVGRDAQRVTAALAPYAQIQYDGLSVGLDGSVTLAGLRVTPAGSHRVYRADSATFDSPGIVWLLGSTLGSGNALPDQFGVSVSGLTLPPEPWLNPQWLDPSSYVLFASAGCSTPLGDADFRQMGMDKPAAQARLHYRFDADQHALDATLDLSAPGFAALGFDAQLSRFDPATLLRDGFWKKTHLDQWSAKYTDDGFMLKRNRYCGSRQSIGPAQFAEHNVDAALALLRQSGIEPGEDVVKLYRTLVEQGGQASLLSLPSPGFSPAAWAATSNEELLRQLNVTARYGDKPPIMLRLAIVAPAPEAPPIVVAAPAVPAVAASAPAAPPAAVESRPAPVPEPKSPAPEKSAPVAIAPPKNYLDRAEEKLTPKIPPSLSKGEPPKTVVPETAPPEKPAAPNETIAGASGTPSTSTQALIWKPGVVEQLPEAVPLKRDYTVVDFSSLPQLASRHVRLLTAGGKQIEGFVVSADGAQVQLRIDRGGGDALIDVNRDRIAQIRLLNW